MHGLCPEPEADLQTDLHGNRRLDLMHGDQIRRCAQPARMVREGDGGFGNEVSQACVTQNPQDSH